MSTYLVLNPADKYALTIQPDAVKLKTDALAKLAGITEITSHEQLQAAADALAQAQGVVKGMEKTRKDVKAPIIDAGKRIDKMADDFAGPVETAMEPVRKLIGDYQAAETKRLQAERDAETARVQEAERARQAEEARIEAARVERERLAAEAEKARQQTATTAAPEAEVESDPIAALRQLSEEEELEEQRELEAQKLAEIEAQRISDQNRLATPTEPAKVAGVSYRAIWRYEILDLNELASKEPTLVRIEARAVEINRRLQMFPGKEIPGLRIWEENQTTVRAK